MQKSFNRALATVASFYALAGLTVYLAITNPAQAAGKSVTVTPNSFATSTPTDIAYTYTSTSEYASGDVVTITAASANVTLAACTAPTTDADVDSTNDGAAVASGQTYTYTFTGATTKATTTGMSFCIKVSSATAGNYSLAFTDNKNLDANNDFGAALVYIGDSNDVTVTAVVQPVLTFVIRNSTDTTNTNVCDLGVLNPAAVNSCSYLLKVGTNANSGYTVSIATDGDLRRSGSGDVVDADDIDRATDGAGAIVSGTEAYGIALTANATSVGATITENSGTNTYNTDDSPLPTLANGALPLYASSSSNNPTLTTHSALVTHRATVDTATNTGTYQQVVTYYVVANF